MLKVLAKQVLDCFLPEALYENMTFRSGEETERSVKSEVEISAMSLGVRMKDDRDKREADLEEDNDGEDSDGKIIWRLKTMKTMKRSASSDIGHTRFG